jgi:mono/diheme cytochrome c family protein
MFPDMFRKMSRLRFERARLPAAPQRPTRLTAALGAAVALLTLAAVSPFSAQAQKPSGASVTADLPAGAMQAKATTACLECHEARIILQQRLSKAAWTREVDKMVKWGAVVDPSDREALIDYLSTNFSPDTPPYDPQRTSGAKSSSGR